MRAVDLLIGLLVFSITAYTIGLFNSSGSSSCTVIITGERAVVTGCEITPELSNLLLHLKPHSHSLGF
uniref:Movement protein TGBp3 n=1 Tax=Cherry necrotic rusty mottle virus TaxID=129143 RepID=A0A0S2SVS5_9VIRU|nr:triple gene block protein 3 [Cherry necrotic rusty mottle virus]ALP45973.1 triple gene block protein 3 [Cherry necrotic rusty mottle virus]